MPATPPQIAVIGLDGADWRLLRPWLDAGHLPTLAKLVETGASGDLMSTIRPESSVAWSSFATGVNPGKHGVYGFMRQTDQEGQFEISNGSHIQANRFWDLLGNADKQVGLINIPFTYPPRPVNGFLISGMLTPNDSVNFTHPPELKSQLLNQFKSLTFDAGDDVSDKQTLLDGSNKFTQQQIDLSIKLLKEQTPDFFSVVFTALDRLQHFLWSDLDPNHPEFSDQSDYFSQQLLQHMQLVDAGIEKIISQLTAGSLVILISDHGFNSFARRFYINRWLIQKGLLVIQASQNQRNQTLVQLLEKMKNVKWLRMLKQALLPTDWGPQKLATALNTQSFDWEKSQVYYSPDGGLRVNSQASRFNGALTEDQSAELLSNVTQELMELIDPETGNRPIAEIYRSADLYQGDQLSKAPDLIVEPQRSAKSPLANYILDSKIDSSSDLFTQSDPYSGNHDQKGIFIAHGEQIKSQNDVEMHIMDVAPTVLSALNLPIPNYIDGRPLIELFEAESQPEIKYVESPMFDEGAIPEDENEDDEDLDELIEERLRNLGYLD